MDQTTELLNGLSEDEIAKLTANSGEEPHIVIGPDRKITVPESLKRVAVQYDHNVETVTFDCPRYWDGIDMKDGSHVVYINYMLSDHTLGSYIAENVTVDDADPNIMHFDWTISSNVSQVNGGITFLVCIKKVDDEGIDIHHWNSELCKDLYVSEGLEVSDQISEMYPDFITKVLIEIDRFDASSDGQLILRVENVEADNADLRRSLETVRTEIQEEIDQDVAAAKTEIQEEIDQDVAAAKTEIRTEIDVERKRIDAIDGETGSVNFYGFGDVILKAEQTEAGEVYNTLAQYDADPLYASISYVRTGSKHGLLSFSFKVSTSKTLTANRWDWISLRKIGELLGVEFDDTFEEVYRTGQWYSSDSNSGMGVGTWCSVKPDFVGYVPTLDPNNPDEYREVHYGGSITLGRRSTPTTGGEWGYDHFKNLYVTVSNVFVREK